MDAWGSLSFAFGPLVAFCLVGVLILLLRWAFGPSKSLVARRPHSGDPKEYGLLVPVARPGTFVEAEIARRHLEAAGIRATLAPTTHGPLIMVFPDDVAVARRTLERHGPPPPVDQG
jgi:hypothetical protein